MEIIGVHAHNVCKRLAPYLLPAYLDYQDKYITTGHLYRGMSHVTNTHILTCQYSTVDKNGLLQAFSPAKHFWKISMLVSALWIFIGIWNQINIGVTNIFGSLWAINNNLALLNDKFSTAFQTVSDLNENCKYLLTLLKPLLYHLYQLYSVSTISKYSDKIIYWEECCILTWNTNCYIPLATRISLPLHASNTGWSKTTDSTLNAYISVIFGPSDLKF